MNNYNIICLVTSARGGSKLFHSLLDGHEDIVCLPRTFRMTSFLKDINHDLLDSDIIADIFIEKYPRFFNGNIWSKFNSLDKADQLGDMHDESFIVRSDIFKDNFRNIYNIEIKNTKNLFLCLHYAYHKSKGLTHPDFPFILYHPHDISNLSDIELCVKDHGLNRVKVIFTTRHPVDGLRSVHNVYLFHNILTPATDYYIELSMFTYNLTKSFPNINLRIVPLDIIKAYRKKVMLHLCSWTGLKWNDILIQSTLMNKKWLGNAEEIKGDEVLEYSTYEPCGFFENNDTKIFNTLFSERMEMFGGKYKNRLNSNILLRIIILIPMSQELKAFMKSLSPHYMVKTIYRLMKDINFNKNIYKGMIKGKYSKLYYIYIVIKSTSTILILFKYFKRVNHSYKLMNMDFSKENKSLLFYPKI